MVTTITFESDFGVRLASLLSLLLLLGLLWYKSKDIDRTKSYYHLFSFLIFRYMTLVYLVSTPFLFLLLHYSISFEIFVYFIASTYLIGFVLGFGLLLLYAKQKITSFVSKENNDVYRERKKYSRQNG